MAVIDLSQLPPPQIVDVPDFETLLSERKAEFVALFPAEEQEAVARTLTLESEPVVKMLQENVYRELLLRQRINEAAKAVMVAYSGGDTRTYKHNIEAPEPSVYVVLRRADTLSGWTLYLATIDPAEAHSHADTGDDLVERLPMPPLVFDWLSAFVAQHHVERMEWKRKRDRADPDALGVRGLAAEEQRGRRQAGWEDEDE